MTRVMAGLGIAVVLVSGTAARAQERIYTRALTCSAVKEIVAREHDVVLATSETSYEFVHNNAGF